MNKQFKLTQSGAAPDAISAAIGSGPDARLLAIVSGVASRADTRREEKMNREKRVLRHRSTARVRRMPPGVRAGGALANAAVCAPCQQWARLDDASGSALEVGQVEHWDSIEHIEYGNYMNEFDIGGGNAIGSGSGYDGTGEQR